MPPQSELGATLFRLRKQSGLTREELSRRCRVSHSSIYRYEAGQTTPRTAEALKRIVQVLSPRERDLHELLSLMDAAVEEQKGLPRSRSTPVVDVVGIEVAESIVHLASAMVSESLARPAKDALVLILSSLCHPKIDLSKHARLIAEARLNLGNCCLILGDLVKAERELSECLLITNRLSDLTLRARLHNVLGVVLRMNHPKRWQHSVHHLSSAHGLYSHWNGSTTGQLAQNLRDQGRAYMLSEDRSGLVERFFERSLRMSDDAGLMSEYYITLNERARWFAANGKIDAALADYARLEELMWIDCPRIIYAKLAADRAAIFMLAGDIETAAKQMERAKRISEAGGYAHQMSKVVTLKRLMDMRPSVNRRSYLEAFLLGTGYRKG